MKIITGSSNQPFAQKVADHCFTDLVPAELDNEKGKFGRVLGTVWAEGTNINSKMIDEHMAVAYHGQAKSDIEAEHLQNRELLKEQGKI